MPRWCTGAPSRGSIGERVWRDALGYAFAPFKVDRMGIIGKEFRHRPKPFTRRGGPPARSEAQSQPSPCRLRGRGAHRQHARPRQALPWSGSIWRSRRACPLPPATRPRFSPRWRPPRLGYGRTHSISTATSRPESIVSLQPLSAGLVPHVNPGRWHGGKQQLWISVPGPVSLGAGSGRSGPLSAARYARPSTTSSYAHVNAPRGLG